MAEQTPNGNLVKTLAQAGISGVCLALIFVIWNIVSNHINDNTRALYELKGSIEKSNEISEEQASALDGLKDAIIQLKVE